MEHSFGNTFALHSASLPFGGINRFRGKFAVRSFPVECIWFFAASAAVRTNRHLVQEAATPIYRNDTDCKWQRERRTKKDKDRIEHPFAATLQGNVHKKERESKRKRKKIDNLCTGAVTSGPADGQLAVSCSRMRAEPTQPNMRPLIAIYVLLASPPHRPAPRQPVPVQSWGCI